MEPAEHVSVNVLANEINVNSFHKKENNEGNQPDKTEKLSNYVMETKIDDEVITKYVTEDNIGNPEENPEDGNRHTCCCVCVCCHKNPKRNRSQMYEKLKKRSNQIQMGRWKSQCEKCSYCCKRFLAFMFSHIGLCSLVVAYAILGGFIFMKIEAPEEAIIRHDVETRRKFQVDKLWNLTKYNNIFHKLNWTIHADAILVDFQKEIYIATKEKGWDGQKEDGDPQWTFAGSLLYSVTVITTIGYGNIAPKTNLGRLITMAYAIIGIPLTLLCLANLGSMMGDCFRFLYKYFCKIIICLCCPQQAQWYAKRRSKHISNIPSDIQTFNTNLSGLKLTSLNDSNVSKEGDQVQLGKEERVRVPIFVSLLLIASYILAGAVIFSSWEGWDLIIGSYFCFITLSTIGFGDYVPGSNSYSFDNQEKMVICCLYLIFGLSMIAMCFNLMQEEVRAKFRWLGQKIGIIENK